MVGKRLCTLLLCAVMVSACRGLGGAPGKVSATGTALSIDQIAERTVQALRVTGDPEQQATAAPRLVLPATQPPLPSATPWPDPVRIHVSIDTNCRSGPGPAFPMVGALMVGETTLIVARSEDADYWVVENPDNPGRECWLWGRHATVVGEPALLPLAGIPPTSTPAPGVIAGWAYFDADDNGVRGDPGDLPLIGIRLTLRVGPCPGGLSVSTVETDALGRYQLPNLIPTLYCLSRDATQQVFPNTWSINLSPGQLRDEVNFRQRP